MKPDNLLNFALNSATQKHTDGAYRRLKNVDHAELARRESRRVSEAIKIRDDYDMLNQSAAKSGVLRNTTTDNLANTTMLVT